jgi:hypothetical protein
MYTAGPLALQSKGTLKNYINIYSYFIYFRCDGPGIQLPGPSAKDQENNTRGTT